jgi:hypothetical protein
MSSLGKLWTNSIAYIALAVGAGLSIMYNVLETMAVRGANLGIPDIVTAVAMPGIVVLMVEMFVSRWWIGRPWHMQTVRVLATATIGGVAMRASWTHGHAWMLSHGQERDVAAMWPLAIDLLAIVATALILAGRRTAATDKRPATRGHGLADIFGDAADVATRPSDPTDTDMATLADEWPDTVATRWVDDGHGHAATDCADMATEAATDRVRLADMDMTTGPASFTTADMGADADIMATRPQGDLAAWQSGYERALDRLGTDVAVEAEKFLATVTDMDTHRTRPTARTSELPKRTRTAPGEFLAMVADNTDWTRTGRAAFVVMAADRLSVSTRTARRWLSAARPADTDS